MSWQALVWSTTQVPPGLVKLPARAVLDVYAEAADEHGRQTYQSHVTVAWRLGCSVRNVSDHVEALKAAGLLLRSDDQSAVAHLPADARPVVYDLPMHWVREDSLDDFRDGERQRRRAYRKPKPDVPAADIRYEENFRTGMKRTSYREPEGYEEDFRTGTKNTSAPVRRELQTNRPSTVLQPSRSPGQQLDPIESPTDATKTGDPDGFAEFWKIYPRKVARGAAVKAFANALTKTDLEEILAGARRYADERRNEKPKFTAHATSWLNQERWADESAAERFPNHERGFAAVPMADPRSGNLVESRW